MAVQRTLPVIMLFAALATGVAAEPPAGDVNALMAEMARERGQFDVEKLRRLGRAGLVPVLDRLLPQTVAAKAKLTPEEAAKLVKELGSDDFELREAATAKLSADGGPYRKLLTAALKSEDLEVRTRAGVVLEALKKKSADGLAKLKVDVAPYYDAMLVYLQGLEDEGCVRELAVRTRAALEKGVTASQRVLLRRFMSAIAKSRSDAAGDLLKPLFEHEDERTAVWVVGAIGANAPDDYFPSVLLAALKSERKAVKAEALDWTPNCRDAAKRAEVKRLVTAVFEGDDEELKFEACFPLMRDFNEPRAVEYLLAQVGSSDWKRAKTAIYWVGNACNSGKPVTPAILEKVGPLLKSKDADRRRGAVHALGTYRGAEVVKRLIPVLADENAVVAREAAWTLSKQADRKALKELLAEAAKGHEDATVKSKAAEILKGLKAGE
ncbi:MAG: HEAT repeat domain-containing protein [Planctomycetota bacterium]|jgi:HEAT repeat protein